MNVLERRSLYQDLRFAPCAKWRRRAVRQRERQEKAAMEAALAAARISRVPAGQRGNDEVQEGQGAGRAAVRRDASAM